MKVLVTGGAGYIGAHVVRLLQQAGAGVVVVDDLSTSHPCRVGGARLVQLDLSRAECVPALTAVLREESVDAVVHFAAKKQNGESVERPLYYYAQNVGGLTHLLTAMREACVETIIFSSSASVYGAVDVPVITEDTEPRPMSPYGQTKLIGEWMLAAAERAHGLRWVALRYFNVAGAGWVDLGDPVALNLIPMVFEQLGSGRPPRVFGTDYPTPDGTCLRDYVHVRDLAQAHIVALEALTQGRQLAHRVYNVGTGRGTSVREVIGAVARVTGQDCTPVLEDRRPGDPPRLVAGADRLEADLGYRARAGLEEIVASAWDAWQVAPAAAAGVALARS